MSIKLYPVSSYGIGRLREICLPEEQLCHVRFSERAAYYEAAGNPWCMAIDCDGACIGYITAEEDAEGDLYIHKFVVDYSHQHQGIGTEAMEQFLRLARSHDSQYVFLSVAAENEAGHRFYKTCGFRQTELGIAEAGCCLYEKCLR